ALFHILRGRLSNRRSCLGHRRYCRDNSLDYNEHSGRADLPAPTSPEWPAIDGISALTWWFHPSFARHSRSWRNCPPNRSALANRWERLWLRPRESRPHSDSCLERRPYLLDLTDK